jgi:hypothetical protein
MSPDISANRRENKTSFPTYQAQINTTPIARGEESAHTYATLSLARSLDNKARLRQHAASAPRIIDNIQAVSYHGERPTNSSFKLFPVLPPEIRLYVWQYALSVPRIVEIDFVENWHYRSRALPPLLSCNRESRKECLKAYSTCNDISASMGMAQL